MNNFEADDERDFRIAATNDGGFMLAFVDDDSPTDNDTRILWQRHDAAGDLTTSTSTVIVTNDPASTVSNPQLVVNTVDNSSFVTWQETPDAGDPDIFGIRIGRLATPIVRSKTCKGRTSAMACAVTASTTPCSAKAAMTS